MATPQTTITKKPVTSAQPPGVPSAPEQTSFSSPTWQQAYDMSMQAQRETVQQGTQFAQAADTASKVANTRSTQQQMFANQSNGQTPADTKAREAEQQRQFDHEESMARLSAANAAKQRSADKAMSAASNASNEKIAGTNSYAQQSTSAINASGSFRVDPQYKFWG